MLSRLMSSWRAPSLASHVGFGGLILLSLLVTAAAIWLTADHGVAQTTPPSRQDGVEVFVRIATVLQSPRCLNCHALGDRPTQGKDRRIHLMNVQRGVDGKGLPAMRCTTCHQDHNNDYAGVPGAPHWHLAPIS
jgi:hypothetical protein